MSTNNFTESSLTFIKNGLALASRIRYLLITITLMFYTILLLILMFNDSYYLKIKLFPGVSGAVATAVFFTLVVLSLLIIMLGNFHKIAQIGIIIKNIIRK